MIPIYFPDSRKVSQIFISDIANKPPNLSALEFINRGEPSINCSSDIPYIAIVVNLGERSSFRTRWYQCGDDDGPSLRIYATGIDQDTFPFLETHDIVAELRDLASPPADDDESLSVLINQVKFGSTSEDSHMCWELRGEHTRKESERMVEGSDSEHDVMGSSTEGTNTP